MCMYIALLRRGGEELQQAAGTGWQLVKPRLPGMAAHEHPQNEDHESHHHDGNDVRGAAAWGLVGC